MNVSTGSFPSRFKKLLVAIGSLLLLGLANPSFAGMVWTARAIDPSLVSAIKTDNQLLRETLFGEPPKALTEKLKKEGQVDLGANRELMNELNSWAEHRKAEVGDTEVDLDKAWHGISYLLTGSAAPNGTLASKVIWGGEDIGPDQGYGPAQLLAPEEVKAIAQLLEQTSPEMLRERFKPKEMTRAGVYPGVIWERDGDEALKYVLEYYNKLVAFYKRAAQRGQAVIFAIS
jgi:Domain of unknown function (DUF1877)